MSLQYIHPIRMHCKDNDDTPEFREHSDLKFFPIGKGYRKLFNLNSYFSIYMSNKLLIERRLDMQTHYDLYFCNYIGLYFIYSVVSSTTLTHTSVSSKDTFSG